MVTFKVIGCTGDEGIIFWEIYKLENLTVVYFSSYHDVSQTKSRHSIQKIFELE